MTPLQALVAALVAAAAFSAAQQALEAGLETVLPGAAVGGEEAGEEQYAIVVMTFNRTEQLAQILSHYAPLPRLGEIYVVWNNVGEEPPVEELEARVGRPVTVLPQEVNSFNNRFQPIPEMRAEAVLMFDDDLTLPLDEIELAFDVWRHHRDQIVGFIPRSHSGDTGARRYSCSLAGLSAEYNMIITRTLFFHKEYLDLYTNRTPKAVRDFVDINESGEDIAFNFAVANATGLPPVFVKGHKTEIRAKKEFKGQNQAVVNWWDRRHASLDENEKIFGAFPLVSSDLRYELTMAEKVC